MNLNVSKTSAIVLSAPSGVGKTSIADALVQGWDEFVFSVSATTRSAREDETDGVHYHFVKDWEFQEMLDSKKLLEWAEVHGYMYGTPKDNLNKTLRQGQYLVMDIDVQGAMQVRESISDAVLIFVLPPSADILADRIRGRGTEDYEILRRRFRNAREELKSAMDFDYVVVNEGLDQAVIEVRTIARGEVPLNYKPIDLSYTIGQLQGQISEIIDKDLNYF
jgi:guanylate kinase